MENLKFRFDVHGGHKLIAQLSFPMSRDALWQVEEIELYQALNLGAWRASYFSLQPSALQKMGL
jgi:hypothetical protein